MTVDTVNNIKIGCEPRLFRFSLKVTSSGELDQTQQNVDYEEQQDASVRQLSNACDTRRQKNAHRAISSV